VNLEVRGYMVNLGVDGKIILERVLGKFCGKEWTGCIWLRTGTSGRLLWTRRWTFGFRKRRGACSLCERLWASQGFCPMELVSRMVSTLPQGDMIPLPRPRPRVLTAFLMFRVWATFHCPNRSPCACSFTQFRTASLRLWGEEVQQGHAARVRWPRLGPHKFACAQPVLYQLSV
jgi:hypothetical protein